MVRIQSLIALLVCCTLMGCGEESIPSGSLSGDVYSNGKLVDDCIVSLYNTSSKRSIGGKVNEQGKFQLDEIPLGAYEISVLQKTSNSAKNAPFDERIPSKYRDGRTSEFSIDIKEGDNSISLKMVR